MTTIEALQQQVAEAEQRFHSAQSLKQSADKEMMANFREWRQSVERYAAAVEEFKLAFDLYQTAERTLDEATGKDAKVTA